MVKSSSRVPPLTGGITAICELGEWSRHRSYTLRRPRSVPRPQGTDVRPLSTKSGVRSATVAGSASSIRSSATTGAVLGEGEDGPSVPILRHSGGAWSRGRAPNRHGPARRGERVSRTLILSIPVRPVRCRLQSSLRICRLDSYLKLLMESSAEALAMDDPEDYTLVVKAVQIVLPVKANGDQEEDEVSEGCPSVLPEAPSMPVLGRVEVDEDVRTGRG